ncbi:hypothetical protein ACLQ24_16775 [Micromonospora sp. DT4]|uniref:hypothetical protein n=1 Tax=Micromonospora sp. DT4 TaxID=3393438 RepID=UPI003CF71597
MWLFADDHAGVVVPRWVDTTKPGLFLRRAEAEGAHTAMLADPDSRLLFVVPGPAAVPAAEFIRPSFATVVDRSRALPDRVGDPAAALRAVEQLYRDFFGVPPRPGQVTADLATVNLPAAMGGLLGGQFTALVSAADVTRGLTATPGALTIAHLPSPSGSGLLVGVSRFDPVTNATTVEWIGAGVPLSESEAWHRLSGHGVTALTLDPAGAPVPVSGRIAAAVAALPPWTQKTDGVTRVAAVLRRVDLTVKSDDTSAPPIDDVARRLDGSFASAHIQVLLSMKAGSLTAVRVNHPDAPPHLLLVERQQDGGFTLIDPGVTRPRDAGFLPGTFTRFDPNDPGTLPQQLRAPVELPLRHDGTLGQADPIETPRTDTARPLAADHETLPVPSPTAGHGDALTEDVVLPPDSSTDEEHPGRLYWVGLAPAAPVGRSVRAAAAGPGSPIIFLGAERGQIASVEATRALRRLVQQFALKKTQPVVVTEAKLDAALTKMSTTYGFNIVHFVLKSLFNGLDSAWLMRHSEGNIKNLGSSLTGASLNVAAASAKSVNDSTGRAISKLILARNRAAKRNVLNTFRQELSSQPALEQLTKIVEQTEGDPWFNKNTPLLETLNTPHATDFVLDFHDHDNDPGARNRLLFSELARDLARDPLLSGSGGDLRLKLLEASGHATADARTALTAVDLLHSRGIDEALRYVKQHSASLRTNQKQEMVDEIRYLAKQAALRARERLLGTSGETENPTVRRPRPNDFERLAAEILQC